jgi:hypothetical protein
MELDVPTPLINNMLTNNKVMPTRACNLKACFCAFPVSYSESVTRP